MAVSLTPEGDVESGASALGKNDLEKIEIELLLDGIFRHYGFDFRAYAYSSLRRRLWKRIEAEGLGSVSALQNAVLHEPTVMERLLRDLSVNVTAMFRDPAFYVAFRSQVVPLLRTYPFVRIWHAGCSTGEEVFSMAILLREEGLYDRCRIYATDINDVVLRQAKQPIEQEHIYIAPANYHLLVEEGYFSLTTEAPVRYSRPSIDVMFGSAAHVYGRRLIGVVLTGANEDGSRGLQCVYEYGGYCVVQDPATAEVATMPAAALNRVPRAAMRPLSDIPSHLVDVARNGPPSVFVRATA